jgi:hypothetical protein
LGYINLLGTETPDVPAPETSNTGYPVLKKSKNDTQPEFKKVATCF